MKRLRNVVHENILIIFRKTHFLKKKKKEKSIFSYSNGFGCSKFRIFLMNPALPPHKNMYKMRKDRKTYRIRETFPKPVSITLLTAL